MITVGVWRKPNTEMLKGVYWESCENKITAVYYVSKFFSNHDPKLPCTSSDQPGCTKLNSREELTHNKTVVAGSETDASEVSVIVVALKGNED